MWACETALQSFFFALFGLSSEQKCSRLANLALILYGSWWQGLYRTCSPGAVELRCWTSALSMLSRPKRFRLAVQTASTSIDSLLTPPGAVPLALEWVCRSQFCGQACLLLSFDTDLDRLGPSDLESCLHWIPFHWWNVADGRKPAA